MAIFERCHITRGTFAPLATTSLCADSSTQLYNNESSCQSVETDRAVTNHRQYVLVSERRLVFMWGDVWAPHSHYHVNVWAMIRCHHTTLDIPHTPTISTHLLLWHRRWWRVLIIQRYRSDSNAFHFVQTRRHLFTFSHIIEQKKSTILITNRFWDFFEIFILGPPSSKKWFYTN